MPKAVMWLIYIPGIKKGRYTYQKRLKDVLEVRTLRAQESTDRMLNSRVNEVFLTELTSSLFENVTNVAYLLQRRESISGRISRMMESNKPSDSILFSESPTDPSQRLFYINLETFIQQRNQRQYDDDVINVSKMAWLGLSSEFDSQLQSIIKFALSIPGYHKLVVCDQRTLILTSCVEVLLLLKCLRVLPDSNMLIDYDYMADRVSLIAVDDLVQPILGKEFYNFHQK